MKKMVKMLANICTIWYNSNNNKEKRIIIMIYLDIDKIQKEKKILKVGELSQNIIQILGLNEKPKNIKFAYDRISHCDKHISEFINESSYYNTMKNIPQIIKRPDYVGFNVNNNSIEYIKRIDELTLTAVRLKNKGDLFIRSIYPISESKLKNGIKLNRIKAI